MRAFGDTEDFVETFLRKGFSENRHSYLRCDGKLAAALYWFDCFCYGKKYAYLYAVATDEAFRGRGLCRQLMENTHQALKDQGYAGAVLVPGSGDLVTMYGKMGYEEWLPRRAVKILPAGNPIQLRRLNAQEYHTLRHGLLPRGAMEQTLPALEFLESYGELYQGENCLFSVVRKDGRVMFQEFLGEESLLPNAVKALGVSDARALISGGTHPCAMYHKLAEDAEIPTYFAIALD